MPTDGEDRDGRIDGRGEDGAGGRTDGRTTDRTGGRPDDRTDDRRFSLRLPPFRLPAFFPPDFELRFPIPGSPSGPRVGARTVLLACIAFDVVDAVLAFTAGSPLVGGVRALGGLVLAASVADVVGLAYGWELLAVLLGVPTLTAFPSLTALLVLAARR